MTPTELTKEDRSELHVLSTEAFQAGCPRVEIAPGLVVLDILDQLTAAADRADRLEALVRELTESCEENDYDEAWCFFCGEHPEYIVKGAGVVIHEYVHAADCAYAKARASLGEGGSK
jgi:hypothetical protein